MKALFRKIRSLFTSGPVNTPKVLCYHRVADLQGDVFNLIVSPDQFEEQIRFVAEHKKALSEEEFIRCLEKDKFPENAVLITFDDGYKDNLINALPILEKYKVPAVFFITSGFIKKEAYPWWDLIRISVENGYANKLASLLELTLDDLAIQNERIVQLASAYENALQITQLKVISACLSFEGVKEKVSALFMDESELRKFTLSNFVSIGAHTKTHPVLSTLDYAGQLREIKDSIDEVALIVNRKIRSFAYPHGVNGKHFNADTIRILDELGVHAGFAVISNNRTNRSHRFEIPRKSMFVAVTITEYKTFLMS